MNIRMTKSDEAIITDGNKIYKAEQHQIHEAYGSTYRWLTISLWLGEKTVSLFGFVLYSYQSYKKVYDVYLSKEEANEGSQIERFKKHYKEYLLNWIKT